MLDPRFIFPVGSPAHRAASASGRTPRLVAPRVEEPGYFDTRGLIYGDRKKPKLRIKKSRRGRRVRIKVRARDNKNVDRLIVDLGKPVDRYIERDPGRKRRKLSFKESVPKGTRVGVVALDQAGNAREKRFRARGRRRGPK